MRRNIPNTISATTTTLQPWSTQFMDGDKYKISPFFNIHRLKLIKSHPLTSNRTKQNRGYFINGPLNYKLTHFVQTLWMQDIEMNQEETSLIQELPLYHCNTCREQAQHPVLPPCGHLHCWKCLHMHQQCPACEAPFLSDDLFSIFIDHGEPMSACENLSGIVLPPKPKPKQMTRVRNSSSMQHSSTQMLRFQDNMSQEVQLAGYGLQPPLLISSISSANFADDEPEEEERIGIRGNKTSLKYLEWILLVVVIGLIFAM